MASLSASDLTQVIAVVGTPAVALAAIAANVWTSRRTLQDKQEERLWSSRSALYVDLVRGVMRERRQDLVDILMTVDTLDRMPNTYWQSERDRNPRAWTEREVSVLAYASDQARRLYFEWDQALLRLAGVIHPPSVTGVARPDDLVTAVQGSLEAVVRTGDRLLEQIRLELQSSAGRRRRTMIGRVSWVDYRGRRAHRRSLHQTHSIDWGAGKPQNIEKGTQAGESEVTDADDAEGVSTGVPD